MTGSVLKANAETQRPARGGHFAAVFGLGRLYKFVVAWNRRNRDWKLLTGLNDQNLRDIGLDGMTEGRDSTVLFWRLRLGLGPDSGANRQGARGRGGKYLEP